MEDILTADRLANAIGFAITAIIIAGGILRGWLKGAPDPIRKGDVMEVAGALIDGKDARALIEAIDRCTRAMHRCGEATEQSAKQVADANREMRRMTDELIRSQH